MQYNINKNINNGGIIIVNIINMKHNICPQLQ